MRKGHYAAISVWFWTAWVETSGIVLLDWRASPTLGIIWGINILTAWEEDHVSATPDNDKEASLRRHHALNPRPEGVSDPAFGSGDPFFDARDLVQVKYEMLRRALQEGSTVSAAAAAFGFSRPSFYEAKASFESGGLPGLLPRRPGPRRAHKLSEAVVARLEEALEADPSLGSADLVELVRAEFDLVVHSRSVERALARRPKDERGPTP
jgi:transposase